MWKKVLTVTAAIIVTTSAFGSADGTFEKNYVSTRPAATSSGPNTQGIIADLVGHHMYVSETVPGIWMFSSPAGIHRGDIRSARLNGNTLEYHFTMILVDQKAPNEEAYKAETLIAYRFIDNSWQLQTVENLAFNTAGNLNTLLSEDC